MGAIFWWVILPYAVLITLVLGTLYRYVFDRMNWTAPSTEIFEKKWLRVASLCFHWGIIMAFIGHVMGVFIPREFYLSLGVSDHLYHVFAIAGGSVAGILVVIGLVVMLVRKSTITRIRVHATFSDYFVIVLLLIVAGLGTYMTLIYNTTVVAYEYRTSIGPWFRSLFTLQPKYELMRDVPLVFQIHVIAAYVLFAAIPFTKLVHMFSFPGRYPVRAPQQHRSRNKYKPRPTGD